MTYNNGPRRFTAPNNRGRVHAPLGGARNSQGSYTAQGYMSRYDTDPRMQENYDQFYDILGRYLGECDRQRYFPSDVIATLYNILSPNYRNQETAPIQDRFADECNDLLDRVIGPDGQQADLETYYRVIAQVSEKRLQDATEAEGWKFDRQQNRWMLSPWAQEPDPRYNDDRFGGYRDNRRDDRFGGYRDNDISSMGFSGKSVLSGMGGRKSRNVDDATLNFAKTMGGSGRKNHVVPEDRSEYHALRETETRKWEREGIERSQTERFKERSEEARAKGGDSIIGNSFRAPVSRMSEEAKANGYTGPAPTSSISSNESLSSQLRRGENRQEFIPDEERYNIPRPIVKGTPEYNPAPSNPAPSAPFGVSEVVSKSISSNQAKAPVKETFTYKSMRDIPAFAKSSDKATSVGFDMIDSIKAIGDNGTKIDILDLSLNGLARDASEAVEHAKPLFARASSFMARLTYKRIRMIDVGARSYMNVREALRKNEADIINADNPGFVLEDILGTILSHKEYDIVRKLIVDEYNARLLRHDFSIFDWKNAFAIESLADIGDVINHKGIVEAMGEHGENWKAAALKMLLSTLSSLFTNATFVYDDDDPRLNDILYCGRNIFYDGVDTITAVTTSDQKVKDRYFNKLFDGHVCIYSTEKTYYTDILKDEEAKEFMNSYEASTPAENSLFKAMAAEDDISNEDMRLGESLTYGSVPLFSRKNKKLDYYEMWFPVAPFPIKSIHRLPKGDEAYDVTTVTYNADLAFQREEDFAEEPEETSRVKEDGGFDVNGTEELTAQGMRDKEILNRDPSEPSDLDYNEVLDAYARKSESEIKSGTYTTKDGVFSMETKDDKFSKFK